MIYPLLLRMTLSFVRRRDSIRFKIIRTPMRIRYVLVIFNELVSGAVGIQNTARNNIIKAKLAMRGLLRIS